MVNLTQFELAALVDATAGNELHRAFVWLGYYHGLRRGELLALKGTDIQNGHIRIVRLKQRKTPIINVQPLHKAECALVVKLAEQAGHDRIFKFGARHASGLINRYLKKAGVYTFARQKSLHSLRHSTGTNLYRNGHDIVAVAQYLGQKNIESARRYTHLSEAEVHTMAAKAL